MGGTKQKTGKLRKDKYYHLAKETGYRARSAFKLIEINRQYNFLEKAHVLIDLCAAPGGWMQVAHRNMPANSVIVGVDLDPIKPIKGCIGLVADITTEKCRQMLKKEVKGQKADVVLHDGAPNVGAAWLKDAFTQVELVLKSMKLAVEFLAPGGTFVTKVFRSRDYNSLIWVFNQLFTKCHVTKPRSSRSMSAEIFIVCEGYLAPTKIDPKFLDPKFVFQELDTPARKLDIFHPEKFKRQREGYEEGDYLQHKTINIDEFVRRDNHLDILASNAELTIPADSPFLTRPETTAEIKLLCEDLKVLGKKDFRVLIKWRLQMREYLETLTPAIKEDDEEVEPVDAESSEEDEEATLDAVIKDSLETEASKKKREKRRKAKMKAKLRARLALKMDLPNDVMDMPSEASLFNLGNIKSKKGLSEVDKGDWGMEDDNDPLMPFDKQASGSLDPFDPKTKKDYKRQSTNEKDDDTDEEDDDDANSYRRLLESQLDRDYEEYKNRREVKKKRFKQGKKTRTLIGSIAHVKDGATDFDFQKDLEQNMPDLMCEDYSGAAAQEGEQEANPLIQTSDKETASRRAALWFSQDQFAGLDDDMDDIYDRDSADEEAPLEDDVEENSGGAKRDADADNSEDSFASDDSDDDNDSINGAKARTNKSTKPKASLSSLPGFEVIPASTVHDSTRHQSNLDNKGLAIAAEIFLRKRKREYLDGAFNRFSHNDDELPEWFEEEEHHHRQQTRPETKEMVADMRQREREINDRPIKKVLEAKGRAKKKAMKRMEKVTMKATQINDNAQLSEKEKVAAIRSLFAKAKEKTKHVKPTFVVAKKSGATKNPVRPKGVTGFYKQVDTRMKKDLKAARAKEKTHQRGNKKKHKGKYHSHA